MRGRLEREIQDAGGTVGIRQLRKCGDATMIIDQLQIYAMMPKHLKWGRSRLPGQD